MGLQSSRSTRVARTRSPRDFPARQFGALTRQSVQAHHGLYEGYVKQVNALQEALCKRRRGAAGDPVRPQEALARRLSFESSGMFLHELFFEQYLVAAVKPAARKSSFVGLAARSFGTFRRWQAHVLDLSATRGSGWIVSVADPASGYINNLWVDLHHLCIPAGSQVVFALDLWEHAYWLDYGPQKKTAYVKDALAALTLSCLDRRIARS